MSLLSKFKGDESLMFKRKKLHKLVDYAWQAGKETRASVYKEIADVLGSKDSKHISDMTEDEIKLVARHFQMKLQPACFICHKTIKNDEIGIPVCRHIGMPLYEETDEFTRNRYAGQTRCNEDQNEYI